MFSRARLHPRHEALFEYDAIWNHGGFDMHKHRTVIGFLLFMSGLSFAATLQVAAQETPAHEAPEQDAPATPPPPAAPAALDAADARYAQVLKAIVDRDGLVRYDWLAMPRHLEWLGECIDGYAKVSLPADSHQRLAFWCNAFNANVLMLALEESQKENFVNVQQVGGFFESRPIIVAGETMTLHGLQNDRIRKEGEARIHAALVSAAMSSPPLRDEPYLVDRLNEQLDEQCHRWIGDRRQNFVRGDVLVLNRIMDWYSTDFIGKPYGDRLGFVKAYAAPGSPIARYLENAEKPRIEWESFDWTLNQAPLRPAPRREPEQ
jgi:hypothetical protein